MFVYTTWLAPASRLEFRASRYPVPPPIAQGQRSTSIRVACRVYRPPESACLVENGVCGHFFSSTTPTGRMRRGHRRPLVGHARRAPLRFFRGKAEPRGLHTEGRVGHNILLRATREGDTHSTSDLVLRKKVVCMCGDVSWRVGTKWWLSSARAFVQAAASLLLPHTSEILVLSTFGLHCSRKRQSRICLLPGARLRSFVPTGLVTRTPQRADISRFAQSRLSLFPWQNMLHLIWLPPHSTFNPQTSSTLRGTLLASGSAAPL